MKSSFKRTQAIRKKSLGRVSMVVIHSHMCGHRFERPLELVRFQYTAKNKKFTRITHWKKDEGTWIIKLKNRVMYSE